MSRHLEMLDLSQQDLDALHRARLAATKVLMVFFAALVVIAPAVDSRGDAEPIQVSSTASQ